MPEFLTAASSERDEKNRKAASLTDQADQAEDAFLGPPEDASEEGGAFTRPPEWVGEGKPGDGIDLPGDQVPGGGLVEPGTGEEPDESQMPGDGTYQPPGWDGNRPEFLPEGPDDMPGPHEWEVTDEQTVAGQLEQNLSKDSPLYQVMRQQYQNQYASSGLRNSLMAMTAAEKQIVDTAFQVSAEDARTFARSAEFNAIAKNQFSAAEQAFMHNAMLSDQNFRQARLLQEEQIAGQMAQVQAQISGQARIERLRHSNWQEQAETLHGQQLQVMGQQHQYSVDQMNVAQRHNLQSMEFGSDIRMTELGYQTELAMAQADQSTYHQMVLSDQQFGHQQQLSYTSMVGSMLTQQQGALGMIGASGASPEQMAAAMEQTVQFGNAGMQFLGSLYTSNGGPRVAYGAGNVPPAADYNSYGQNRNPDLGSDEGLMGSAGGGLTGGPSAGMPPGGFNADDVGGGGPAPGSVAPYDPAQGESVFGNVDPGRFYGWDRTVGANILRNAGQRRPIIQTTPSDVGGLYGSGPGTQPGRAPGHLEGTNFSMPNIPGGRFMGSVGQGFSNMMGMGGLFGGARDIFQGDFARGGSRVAGSMVGSAVAGPLGGMIGGWAGGKFADMMGFEDTNGIEFTSSGEWTPSYLSGGQSDTWAEGYDPANIMVRSQDGNLVPFYLASRHGLSPAGTPMTSMGSYYSPGAGFVTGSIDPSSVASFAPEDLGAGPKAHGRLGERMYSQRL